MKSTEIPDSCPECGKPLKRSLGKYGPFLGCTGYPECSFVCNISNHTKVKCPECGNILLVKKVKKYNFFFLGCSNYPECDFIYNLRTNKVKCPRCDYELTIRDSKYGKFIGCSNYPDCDYILNISSYKLGSLLNLEIVDSKYYSPPAQQLDVKNYHQDLVEIRDKLNLSKIEQEEVYKICRNAIENGFRTDLRTLLMASLYTLTKANKIFVDLKKFSEISNVKQRILYKTYKKIRRVILPILNYQIERFSINDYIKKFFNDLNLSEKLKELSFKTIEYAINEGFFTSGKDPKGIAAAAIYISSKAIREIIPQYKLSEVAAISEVTLRSRMKELNDYLSLKLLRKQGKS